MEGKVIIERLEAAEKSIEASLEMIRHRKNRVDPYADYKALYGTQIVNVTGKAWALEDEIRGML